MKKRTKEEIIEKVKELWNGSYLEECQPPDIVEVTFGSDGVVYLKLSSMYGAPGLTFANLKALSDFFETDKIRDERFSYGGCETCDWGSEYGFTLVIGET